VCAWRIFYAAICSGYFFTYSCRVFYRIACLLAPPPAGTLNIAPAIPKLPAAIISIKAAKIFLFNYTTCFYFLLGMPKRFLFLRAESSAFSIIILPCRFQVKQNDSYPYRGGRAAQYPSY